MLPQSYTFKVVKNEPSGNGYIVRLEPVYTGGDAGSEPVFAWAQGGHIKLPIKAAVDAEQFVIGKTMTVTFEESP